MAKNYYHRSFIILKPEAAGFGIMSGREPAGYCKLEIRRGKGRIQICVQDLKPAEELGGIYDVYLVSEDEKIEPLKLASIRVDERGRGEQVEEFDADDVMSSGYPLEMFHALAIVFKSESPEKAIRIGYPLVGYSGKNINVDWEGQVTYRLKGNVYHSAQQSKDTADEPAILEDKEIEEARIAAQEALQDKEIPERNKEQEREEGHTAEILHSEYDKVDAKQQEKGDEPEDRVEADEIEIEEAAEGNDEILKQAYQDTYQEFSDDISPHLWQEDHQDDFEGEVQVDRQCAQDSEYGQAQDGSVKGNYWDNVKDYFTGLFKTYRHIRPFEGDMGEAEWIRVQQPPMAYPGYYADPYYTQAYMTHNSIYPGGSYFDHYIVGLIRKQGQVQYVVYGIPSMYSMMPPINMSGFSRWVPIRNGYGMGYWLVYIDASTGYVVYPYGKE